MTNVATFPSENLTEIEVLESEFSNCFDIIKSDAGRCSDRKTE